MQIAMDTVAKFRASHRTTLVYDSLDTKPSQGNFRIHRIPISRKRRKQEEEQRKRNSCAWGKQWAKTEKRDNIAQIFESDHLCAKLWLQGRAAEENRHASLRITVVTKLVIPPSYEKFSCSDWSLGTRPTGDVPLWQLTRRRVNCAQHITDFFDPPDSEEHEALLQYLKHTTLWTINESPNCMHQCNDKLFWRVTLTVTEILDFQEVLEYFSQFPSSSGNKKTHDIQYPNENCVKPYLNTDSFHMWWIFQT